MFFSTQEVIFSEFPMSFLRHLGDFDFRFKIGSLDIAFILVSLLEYRLKNNF